MSVDGVEGILNADTNDRDLQFRAKILDCVKQLPLFGHVACQKVLNLIEDENARIDSGKDMYDLK